jgi:hypothetical protein
MHQRRRRGGVDHGVVHTLDQEERMNELEWRKASASATNGNCVEVAFHKAAASVNIGNCVEVGSCDCADAPVHVRDSKDQSGPVLRFTAAEWSAFLSGVRAGEFDQVAGDE